MDEPLGALDRRLRGDMQLEIKSLHEQLGITIVYVTHDQEEALSMGDRVVVINRGRIEQVGAPRAVYRNPATPFVADFLGDSLSISAVVLEGQAHTDVVQATIELPGMQVRPGRVRMFWRSDQTSMGDPVDQVMQDGATITVPATVLASAYGGNTVRLRVRLATGDVGTMTVVEDSAVAPGARIGVVLDLLTATFLSVEEAPREPW
jgi:putative spermidine/putrescine transport system ATP-binding protein